MLYSKRTILFGSSLIISASFTRQLMNFTKALVGLNAFRFMLGVTLFFSAALFIAFLHKHKVKATRIALISILLLMGLGAGFTLGIPEERTHLVLYAMLGISAAADFKQKGAGRAFIMAAIFTAIIGVAEELFQKLLPYRVCELRDMALNIVFGIWGAGLYRLSGKQDD